MSSFFSAHRRKFLFFPPIVAALIIMLWMTAGKQPPSKVEHTEQARPVRIIKAQAIKLQPMAEGYGPVKPARVWTAVTQVAGRIIELHPKLRNGEILPQGTLLLRIDSTDYELLLNQANAELAELEVQETNAQASLAIEERNLKLSAQDFQRKKKLLKNNSVSQSTIDDAERVMLGMRSTVQNLRNTLALIPTKRRVLEAKVSGALRDIEHTEIRAPFTLRIAGLEVEADQYVTVGQKLFEGDDVARVEIESQLAMANLRRLFIDRPEVKMNLARFGEQIPEMMGLEPLIRLDLGNHIAEWEGEFVRFSDTVDPETRTIGVVVAVDKPFEKVKPGYRPPLSKGMSVQVLLRGRRHVPRIVIPRSAVRNGAVYVVDESDRLTRQPVSVLFSQGQFSIIGEGLQAGSRVVVSDLVPAVVGMLLRPQIDTELSAMISAAGATE